MTSHEGCTDDGLEQTWPNNIMAVSSFVWKGSGRGPGMQDQPLGNYIQKKDFSFSSAVIQNTTAGQESFLNILTAEMPCHLDSFSYSPFLNNALKSLSMTS